MPLERRMPPGIVSLRPFRHITSSKLSSFGTCYALNCYCEGVLRCADLVARPTGRPAADEIGIASEMMDARLEELMHFGTACADRVVAVYALMVKARHVARSAVVGAKDAQAAPWTGHW